ncbi:helix-turn-helix domain-containing protein [Streptomyces daliensis]|uniref:Helix-turn-helix transcriptional regulator n=1 Tax=Streptomyces daliensis TaxID=299421 RepID=A0A8T4IT32_9ACTN|nr:helix-turn-helix transcriptional regulator [Streptomyces daliensis]
MPALREIDPGESIEAFIGSRIRDARMERRWKQTELGQKVFASGSLISEIERGNEVPTRDLAKRLGVVLGLGNELVNLLRLLDGSQVQDYASGFMRQQLLAESMHEFSAHIPGLLQTEDYARANMIAGQAGDPADIESFVAGRMERQDLIWGRTKPPWLWCTLDEAVLHRDWGMPPEAMRHQLERLLELNRLPHINLSILPFNSPVVTGYLSLLTMPDGTRLAYTEGFTCGAVTKEPDQVAQYQRVYDRIHGDSLSARASTQHIEAAIERHTQ